MLETPDFFCDNAKCFLHVAAVDGRNWAQLPDGRLFGRSIIEGEHLCDACLANPDEPVCYPVNEGPERA